MYKDIIYKGEPTNYKIDENGNVYSLFSNKCLKQSKRANGYMGVSLRIKNRQVCFYIHRLVAIAFIDNPDNLETVNHINGDKTNNCKDNLEWCSYSDNEKHAWDNHLNNSEAVDRAVLQYTMNGVFVKEYKNCAEAVRKTGIKHVHCAAKGARKSAGGYIWKFKYEQQLKDTGHKKPVVQYDLSGKIIATYDSISDAARATDINRKGINDCCNKKIKTSGGYIWKFLSEEIVQ